MWKDSLSLSKASIKSQTDLRLIAEQILGQPARRSQRYVQYHAPDRRDTSPSLTIWADGYKDFGNAASGDIFAFLSAYANFSFQEAVQFLEGSDSQLPSPSRRPAVTDRRSTFSTPSSEWQSAVSHLLTRTQHTLWHTSRGSQARTYLESQGYAPSTIQSRGLGLNLNWHRIQIGDELIWVAPGILYPWRQANVLYGVKIRLPYHLADQPDDLAQRLNLAPGPMKYMQIKGSCLAQTWYGEFSSQTDPALPLILVEGEKDRDNLWQRAADRFNIITLGSATGRIPDALWPHLQRAPWIAIVLDNDPAGQSNATRLADHINSRLLDNPAFTVSLPTKDLTDYLRSGADLSLWLSTLDLLHKNTSPSPLHSVGRGQGWGSSSSLAQPAATSVSALSPLSASERGLGGEVNATPIAKQIGSPRPYAPLTVSERGEVNSSFPNGLPDPLREILLGLHQLTPHGRAYIADHSAAALTLELIIDAIRCDHLPEPSFTIQSLTEISNFLQRHTAPKTIRRGLDQLVTLGFVELIPFSNPLQPISNPIQGGENGKNIPAISDSTRVDDSQNIPPTAATRGRPAQKYHLCDIRHALPKFLENLADRLRESLFAATIPDTVDPTWFAPITPDPTERSALADSIAAATADLDQAYADLRAKTEQQLELRLLGWSARLKWDALIAAPSTPIPSDLSFASGRAYRDAYYQAKVAAAGTEGRQISRTKAAAEIGVNSRTLTRVRARIGIVTEAQYKEFRLHSATNVLEQADSLAQWAAHRRFGRFLKSSSGARIALHPHNPTHNDAWVAAQLAAGHTVVLQVQVASREHLATPAEARQQRERRQYRARCARSTPYFHRPLDADDACSVRLPLSLSPLPTVEAWGQASSSSPLSASASELGTAVNLPATAPLAIQSRRRAGDSRFSLAYIRDQLALRLPYLDAAFQTEPLLRAAVIKIMLTAPFSL